MAPLFLFFVTQRLPATNSYISTSLAWLPSNSLVICPFCCRSWLITCRGIAKKIRYTTPGGNHRINELIAEARRECPNCSHVIDNSDVSASVLF